MLSLIRNVVFILINSVVCLLAQCPIYVQYPCTCTSTRYELVSIVCDHADSLELVLQAIGRPLVEIDSLIITNTVILRLPAYVFQGYSVKRLVLRNNSLSDIDPLAFESPMISHLTELEIRNNLLVSVPTTGIPRLQKLSVLILAKNNIQTIQARAFQNYESKNVLRKLDFSSNQLTTVDQEAFVDLSVIQDINFDKNFFTSIPTEALRRLTTIEDLSFGINQLETISNDALPFPNLKSLSLEVNRIKRLSPETFRWLPNLLYIYLSANLFQTLDPETFKYTPGLKVLAMGNNALTKIPSDAFKYIPGLVRLELSDCKISHIEPGALQTISKVQVIVLTRNNLQIVTRNMFQGLSELYSLDLKSNNISAVDDKAWSRLISLKHLDISSNRISTLETSVFSGTFERTVPATTRVLYLYENSWNCDDRLEWFRRWLRDNMDIMIDAPGYPPAVCRKPDWLSGWHLRLLDPINSNPFSTTSGNLPLVEEEIKLSGFSLTAVILGVILGVFFLTLVLLMVMRYFVSKRRRDNKLEDEDGRRLGSTASGYHSAAGSAFPSPPLQNQNERQGYFLNRPWYWWF